METGVFFFGGVEMDDAGAGPPVPTDRRYSQQEMWYAAERMLDMGVATERAGFDVFWLTEHHFQHEGYEVLPNALLFGSVLAERTEHIKIGALFNIVPQWHPLRLAEDFATMHNLSGAAACWAWVEVPCPARPNHSAPSWAASTTPTGPTPTASTGRCSTRPWM